MKNLLWQRPDSFLSRENQAAGSVYIAKSKMREIVWTVNIEIVGGIWY